MNTQTSPSTTHPFRTRRERLAWRTALSVLVLAAVIMLGAWD